MRVRHDDECANRDQEHHQEDSPTEHASSLHLGGDLEPTPRSFLRSPSVTVERIFEESGAAILPSAAPSLSKCLIPLALTTRADRARRDRRTALLPDLLHAAYQ